MKISIKDFFKTGELWSNLESTIVAIKKQLMAHSNSIKELKNRDSILLQYIKVLQNENNDLKKTVARLDKRLWELNIVSNTENLTIINGSKPYIDKCNTMLSNPNNATSSDS